MPHAAAVPPEKVEQYRRIRALARGATTLGEARAAEARLAAMEDKYPGIRQLADAMDAPPPPPGAGWPGFGGFTGAFPGFADFFARQDVQDAARVAMDVAAQAARRAAERAASEASLRGLVEDGVDVKSIFTARNKLVVTVEIDARMVLEMFRQAAQDPEGLNSVATMIGADVAGEIVAAVEEARR